MRKVKAVATAATVGGTALIVASVLAIHHSDTRCTYNGLLPDIDCTPGAINLAVTQATIGDTICRRGWTATIRPPVSVTQRIKSKTESDYGVPDPHPRPFALEELDHLIPLELGGSPQSVYNLWPEAAPGYRAKDQVENTLRSEVCAGRLSLADAQKQIATDWTQAVSTPTTGNPDQ